VTLQVAWDGQPVGVLEQVADTSREYAFRYTDRSRALSLSLPTTKERFTPAESRPFFEALLPEGTLREQLASQLKLAAGDSYGLLAALGRDCAGAIQIYEAKRMSDPPAVAWLDDDALSELIRKLPTRPLGIRASDERRRLSLAGVQRKAVLVRDATGRFGEPLNGQPSTHIVKPQAADAEYRAIAVNEYFCMRLAGASGLRGAKVDLLTLAEQPCLVVERFDRDFETTPVRRRHQEDLCQALGITPDFKYQHENWAVPSFAALAKLLNRHGAQPGVDRLAVADSAVFNVVIGNADAHAKNIALLHEDDGRVRLAPLYDLVSTAVYPQVNQRLALSIGDEYDAERLGPTEWGDFARDVGLSVRAFAARRVVLGERVAAAAGELRGEALNDGWHDPIIEDIVAVVDRRSDQLAPNTRE
jgi:serine/threonine-protein kinase HipA